MNSTMNSSCSLLTSPSVRDREPFSRFFFSSISASTPARVFLPSRGFGAFSGIIYRLPLRMAPGTFPSAHSTLMRLVEMPHFSAAFDILIYSIWDPLPLYNNLSCIISRFRNKIKWFSQICSNIYTDFIRKKERLFELA